MTLSEHRQRNVRIARRTVHWAVTITIIMLFFMSYGIVFGLFRDSTNDREKTTIRDSIEGDYAITWDVRVSSFVYGSSVTLQFTAIDYPDNFTTPDGRLSTHSVGVQINGARYAYSKGTVIGSISQTIPFNSGNSIDYPFDSYAANVTFYGWEDSAESIPKLGTILKCQEVVMNSLEFLFARTSRERGIISMRISVERTDIGQVYPVFLIVAFWLIAIALGVVALAVVVHEYRRVEAGVLGLFSGAIFAVPALRNTAPLSPAFGCQLDYCSFFWCMLVAVLGFFGCCMRYLYQAKYPPPGAPIDPEIERKKRLCL